MKIGILTFHRAHNYGAVLQCYALQEFFARQGHDVDIIDYRQPVIEEVYRVMSVKGLVYHLIHITGFIKYLGSSIQRYKCAIKFRKFRNKFLKIQNKFYDSCHVPEKYDVYVMGSDQLLSVNITHGLDAVYSGDFVLPIGKRKVAYAISTNIKSVEQIGKEKLLQIINNFDYFSLREKSIAEYVNKQLNTKIVSCVDPTLLSDESYWNRMIKGRPMKRKYVAFYQVRYPQKDKDLALIKAREFARSLNLDFVDISKGLSVDDWLTYIKFSECVVTSSFHATVFSLIFRIPLYALVLGDGSDDRYVDLLKSLALCSSIKDIDEPLISMPVVPADLELRMIAIKQESINYLKNSLA